MLPPTLALVDDDADHLEYLAKYFRCQGVAVTCFTDSDELLTHIQPYSFGFYILDLTLPGVDGVDLIKLLRRRTDAGILVVSGRLAPDVFESVMGAGADMYLVKPVRFEQVTLAIKAVERRARRDGSGQAQWRLDRLGRKLTAPDGAVVELSATDLTLLECFAQAQGAPVARETILERLGKASGDGAADGLNATIFRLRRRIERATPAPQPLQSKSRVGYVFRDPLLVH
jgi:two-component system, OmpR family, response regulator